MIALTRKSDYALVALAYLVRQPDSVSSARGISAYTKIPLPVLMNILKTLSRAGIVASVRGARGGYRLAIDPANVSLKALINALEGPIRLVQCVTDDDGLLCEQAECCPVQGPALRIHQRLQEFLDEVSLAELIGDTVQIGVPQHLQDKCIIDEPSVCR